MKSRFSFKHRFATKVFLSVSLVISIVIILLSVSVYSIYSKDRTKAIVEANLRTLSMTSFSADFMHDNAFELLVSQFNDPKTQNLMYGDSMDSLSLKEERDRLAEQVAANQFVASIYVYNQKQDRILSTAWQSVGTSSDFNDQEIIQLLRTPSERIVPIPRKATTTTSSNKEEVYTYILYDDYKADVGVDGAVILNIKSSYLEDLVRSFIQDKHIRYSNSVLIVNQHGSIISQINMQTPGYPDAIVQSIVARVQSGAEPSGDFVHKQDDDRYIVTNVTSSSLGWKFIDIQDYDQQLMVINQIRGYTIGFALLFLIVGCLVSFIVTHQLTVPIKNLLNKVKAASESLSLSSDSRDEFKAIETVLHKTMSHYQQFEQMRKNELLKSILLSDHDDLLQLGRANLSAPNLRLDEPFQILQLDIDGFSQFASRFNSTDQGLLRYAIRNVVAEQLDRQGMKGEVIDYSDSKQVVWLNRSLTDQPIQEPHDDEAWLRDIQAWIRTHLHLSVTITVSDVVEGLAPIDVYHDVAHLAQYRLVMGHGAIISQHSISTLRQDESYKIPSSLETAFSDAVIAGKYDEAVERLSYLLQALREYRYEVILSNVRYLLFLLYNLSAVTTQIQQQHSFDLNSYNQILNGLETLEDVERFLKEILYQVTQSIHDRREKRSVVIAALIVEHIERHYSDPNLCMDTIADHLGFSKVYISKVFRETYAKTIGDYLLEHRIQKAIEGLVQRDIPIETLLDEIGIENKKYFSSLFKKRTGLSLRDFRLNAIEQSNS